MTAETLNTLTRKELAAMAKERRIDGWHGMRKKELVSALLKARRRKGKQGKSTRPTSKNGKRRGSRRRESTRSRADSPRLMKNLTPGESVRDTLTAEVCDPFWVRVRWQLSQRMLQRAEASLGSAWHRSQAVVRVLEVTESGQEDHVRDVPVSGDVDHWYVRIDNAPGTLRFQIGYAAAGGRFFALARSRQVRVPRPTSTSRNGNSGGRSLPKGFEVEHEPTSSGRQIFAATTSGEAEQSEERNFPFQLDAELVVHGATHPDAQLSLLGETVPLAEDGSFVLRISLPEGRQVIPAVTVTPDGMEQRTIVLAVERNTKRLETESLGEMR